MGRQVFVRTKPKPWAQTTLERMLREADVDRRFKTHRLGHTDPRGCPTVVTSHDRHSITVLLSEHFDHAPREVVSEVLHRACRRCSGEAMTRLGPEAVGYFTSDEYCLLCRRPYSENSPHPMHRGEERPGREPPNIARIRGFSDAVALMGEDMAVTMDVEFVWMDDGEGPRRHRPYAVDRYARLIWLDPVLADPRVPPAVVTYTVLSALAEYVAWSVEDCRLDLDTKAVIVDRYPTGHTVRSILESAGWVL